MTETVGTPAAWRHVNGAAAPATGLRVQRVLAAKSEADMQNAADARGVAVKIIKQPSWYL